MKFTRSWQDKDNRIQPCGCSKIIWELLKQNPTGLTKETIAEKLSPKYKPNTITESLKILERVELLKTDGLLLQGQKERKTLEELNIVIDTDASMDGYPGLIGLQGGRREKKLTRAEKELKIRKETQRTMPIPDCLHYTKVDKDPFCTWYNAVLLNTAIICEQCDGRKPKPRIREVKSNGPS